MLKFFTLLALTILLCMQTAPVYCAGARTMSLLVSATLPDHIMALSLTPFSNNPNQLVQTQTMIRDHKSVQVISIVEP